jgi:hypothetical protein
LLRNVDKSRWTIQVTRLGPLGMLSWSLLKSVKSKTRQQLLGRIREAGAAIRDDGSASKH